MKYLPFICYIVGSLAFVIGPRAAKVGPWLFIVGSLIAMGQIT